MRLFDFLKRKRNQSGSGRDGLSIETAIVINATSTLFGVPAEYEYVASRHGQRDIDWILEYQTLLEQDGRHYDVLDIKLRNSESRSYYFEITQFYGKF